MGPFELADLVGLDTCKFIVDGWQVLEAMHRTPRDRQLWYRHADMGVPGEAGRASTLA
jgi:3-hydroxyacyl-CoA dehydrogenase